MMLQEANCFQQHCPMPRGHNTIKHGCQNMNTLGCSGWGGDVSPTCSMILVQRQVSVAASNEQTNCFSIADTDTNYMPTAILFPGQCKTETNIEGYNLQF